MCRRPAVSMITTSPSRSARSIASYATAAVAALPRRTPSSARPPRSRAALPQHRRGRSAAPARCSRGRIASFPIVVVLPVPLTPTTRITAGLGRDVDRAESPSSSVSSTSASPRSPVVPRASSRCTSSPSRARRRPRDQRLLEPLPGFLVRRVERREHAISSVSARRDLRASPSGARRSLALLLRLR